MTNPAIIKELTEIARANGGVLKAEVVVEVAADKSSPLHSWFEWDDTEAAHQWRLQQARQLIRVCVETWEPNQEPVRVFVNLTTDRYQEEGGGYRSTAVVLANAKMREQMLQDALEELGRVKKKYAQLKELTSIWDALAIVEKRRLVKALS